MRDNSICPMCGHDWFGSDLCPHRIADYFDEIIRLRAALEKAERENVKNYNDVLKSYADMVENRNYWRRLKQQIEEERDEARRLARQYYQLWQAAESELLKRVNSEQK